MHNKVDVWSCGSRDARRRTASAATGVPSRADALPTAPVSLPADQASQWAAAARAQRITERHAQLCPLVLWHENLTLSVKPEVHNVLQRHHRRTKKVVFVRQKTLRTHSLTD